MSRGPIHSVASPPVRTIRSTRAPAQLCGTVAATRSQCVANSGPRSMPNAAGRYSSSRACACEMRPGAAAISSSSTVARSG